MNPIDTLKNLRRRVWVGAAEYYLRPGLKNRGGGPMNGQAFRRRIVEELAHVVLFDNVIECGTHRGRSTGYFLDTMIAEVDTIEYDARFFGYSRQRYANNPRIRVHRGDSRAMLRQLLDLPRLEGRTVFAYLDAHWGADLPLAEEIRILFSKTSQAVAMIDDFCVPGDAGYIYDDYGPGKALNCEYLDQISEFPLRRFFPAIPSSQETGARSGCCVIATASLADAIAEQCQTLVEFENTRLWQAA